MALIFSFPRGFAPRTPQHALSLAAFAGSLRSRGSFAALTRSSFGHVYPSVRRLLALDERFERQAHLAHRAEDAVFRGVGLQPERAADLLDRLAFEVPQHEGGALHAREPVHRAA